MPQNERKATQTSDLTARMALNLLLMSGEIKAQNLDSPKVSGEDLYPGGVWFALPHIYEATKRQKPSD